MVKDIELFCKNRLTLLSCYWKWQSH